MDSMVLYVRNRHRCSQIQDKDLYVPHIHVLSSSYCTIFHRSIVILQYKYIEAVKCVFSFTPAYALYTVTGRYSHLVRSRWQ